MYDQRHIINLKKPPEPKVELSAPEPPPTPAPVAVKRRRGRSHEQNAPRLGVALIIGVMITLGIGVYLQYFKSDSAQPAEKVTAAPSLDSNVDATPNPAMSDAAKAQDIIAKVGELTKLPKGEEPTMAVVSDLAPLKEQAFFADARVGDIVLMYKSAARAVLYRPSDDTIVQDAPITGIPQ